MATISLPVNLLIMTDQLHPSTSLHCSLQRYARPRPTHGFYKTSQGSPSSLPVSNPLVWPISKFDYDGDEILPPEQMSLIGVVVVVIVVVDQASCSVIFL